MTVFSLGGVRPILAGEDDCWIAPTATVAGRVILEKGASVWFGAVLRGDNEPIVVGENSNIQDNSVLHTDVGRPLTIGANVTVGHMVMLHGCEIGAGSLVGIGAIVLNGARIGRGCIIGAGSLGGGSGGSDRQRLALRRKLAPVQSRPRAALKAAATPPTTAHTQAPTPKRRTAHGL
jgi:carbonic anhydrase/acetyltransferase-like protein (isoleucine patch superfamily)